MEAEEFSSWAPVVADVLFYTYYWIIALVIGSIAACCVSATIRTACIAKVVALVLWRLESKQVRGSRRGSVVFKNADGKLPLHVLFNFYAFPSSEVFMNWTFACVVWTLVEICT